VFEDFTERARQVFVLADDEARRLKHAYLGTEHLRLALCRPSASTSIASARTSFGSSGSVTRRFLPGRFR
jgi:ATP-dependent Clp protease ATP-binding subunit ClpA